MQDKLLREAIADANLIRDTAIANARAQLEEAFKPQLASALSARLRNEQNTLDSSDIGAGAVTADEPGPKNPSKNASDSSAIENPDQETTDMSGPNNKPKAVNEVGEMDDMNGGGIDMGVAPEMDDQDQFGGGDDNVDELDLQAIIQQLEADAMNGGDPTAAPQPAPTPDPMAQPNEGFGTDVNAGVKVEDPTRPDNQTMMKRETVNVGDKDANSASKDGKEPTPTKDGVQGGKEVKPGQDVTDDDYTKLESLDLDEILREVEAEEDSKKPWEESKKIAAENVELKSRLREHRQVVVYLKDKLNELNILNSKLLYTTKLFRGFDLTPAKKGQVVETFDRAKTLREVKLIYTTLAESFSGKSGKTPVKQNTTTIKEGLASKPIGSTKPLNEASNNVDEDAFRSRMQKLAGISKIL